MNFVPFNVNDPVRIKLTERGRLFLREQHAAWCAEHPTVSLKYTPRSEDRDGWSEWQMWVLMETFGPAVHNGFDLLFETDILILQRHTPAPPPDAPPQPGATRDATHADAAAGRAAR